VNGFSIYGYYGTYLLRQNVPLYLATGKRYQVKAHSLGLRAHRYSVYRRSETSTFGTYDEHLSSDCTILSPRLITHLRWTGRSGRISKLKQNVTLSPTQFKYMTLATVLIIKVHHLTYHCQTMVIHLSKIVQSSAQFEQIFRTSILASAGFQAMLLYCIVAYQ
jgi:hypothetical protein